MSIVISRSESGLSATTSFQALDNLAGASVSSSFTVPTNVSSIKSLAIAVCADGAGEDFVPLVKISGNAMKDGDAVFSGGGQMTMGTSTGSNMNFVTYDTDLSVQPGNSCEFSVAVTTAASIDIVVTAQFA
jgi:hypothetical protein